jgi:hypothetical protein
LLPSADELRDAPPTLSPELRVSLAAKLRLSRFTTAASELGVSLRAELRLARLAALATETCIPLGPELTLSRLTAALPDLSVERRAMLPGGGGPTLLAGLPDGHVSALLFHM